MGRTPHWLIKQSIVATLERVERVRGMDAVVDYKAETIRSQDFPLRQLLLHLTLDHGVMELYPIAFTFPQGKLAGKVKIDAQRAKSSL